MNFRTQIDIKKEHRQIDYDSNIMLLGSCFAENIGDKFEYFKFQNNINPFGILFHPLAIEKLITDAINREKYEHEDIFLYNERWHCFDSHSELSDISSVNLLQNLNTCIDNTHKEILQASHLIITLGTAWVYRFIETDKIVANCHKIPQKNFLKELLSVEDIKKSMDAIISLVKSVNNNVQIIFTVSPIRHLKDGYIENSLSKAHLLSAIHQVIEPRNHSFYFPSYEIMIDDLRDYRFYKNNMLHPNKTAINYIWEHFKNTWIDKRSFELMNEIASILKSLSHKPFNEKSEKHQQFLVQLNKKIANLEKRVPQIKFNKKRK